MEYLEYALWLVGAILVYFVGSAVYNLYFSPLAKFPGPFFAKISGIPSFYNTLNGTRHVWIWQCHQIYGDVFRFRPNGIIVNSPTGHNAIYGNKVNVKKGTLYDMFAKRGDSRNTLNTIDRAAHAKRRKVLNGVFTDKAVRSAEAFIIRHVDRWGDLIIEDQTPGEWTKPKNVAPLMDSLVFDILGDLAFGKSFNTKEPGDNPLKIIPHTIATFLQFMYPITKSPLLNFWVFMKPKGLDWLLEVMTPPATKGFDEFVLQSVLQRVDEEKQLEKEQSEGHTEQEGRNDMFHYMFQAKDPDTGTPAYKFDELLAEVQLLSVAGTDTTVVALCALIFYLTHNPRVYERLTSEIRSTFNTLDEIVGGPKLASCQYLRACIDETLRIAPPAPTEFPREVLPGGIMIDGEFVPEGTQIATSAWSLMHHDQIFGDPWVYRPERWIVDERTSAEDVARAQSAFHPFLYGPGICVGKKLAMQEMSLVTARTLYRMDIRGVEGDSLGAGAPELGWGRRDSRVFQIKDAYVSIKDGPMVQFRPRKV